MSLRMNGFIALAFDQSDWLKLLGIAGATVALYLVAKRLGGGSESHPSPPDTSSSTQISASQTDPVEPEEIPEFEEQNSDEAGDEERAASGDDLQPHNIQIADWSFAAFEIGAGPPDGNCFADELLLALYDKSSGHTWKQSYFVATPAGLRKMLQDNKSNFMFLPKVLIMNRYDAQELRTAVLEDLAVVEEERGDVPPDASDDEVAGN
jgi:hypothetical protein